MTPGDIIALATLIVSVVTFLVIALDFLGFREHVRSHQRIGTVTVLLMICAIYYLVKSNINIENPGVTVNTEIGKAEAPSLPTVSAAKTDSAINRPPELKRNSGISLIPSMSARPSFPCWKAKTAVEKMICSDGNLADKEQQMVAVYGAILNALPEPDKLAFRKEHFQWFKNYSATCNALQGNDPALKDCISKYLMTHTEDLHSRSQKIL
jgi:hypothetical protein